MLKFWVIVFKVLEKIDLKKYILSAAWKIIISEVFYIRHAWKIPESKPTCQNVIECTL